MTLALIIYFIAILNNVKGLFFALIALGLGGGFLWNFITVLYNENQYKDEDKVKHRFKPFVIALIVGLLGVTFIPTREDAYAIAAAYGVQTIVENPSVQSFASNSVKVIEKAMTDFINEDKTTEAN